MSERDGFEPGVPCWVDTWQPDAEVAVAFYTRLFGWEADDSPVPDADVRHVMLRLRDREVAAIGSRPPGEGPALDPAWGTYVWVEDVDDTVGAATAAGGGVVIPAFDSLDGGRMAVLRDPLWRLPGYLGGEPTQPVPRDVVAVMAPAFGRPAGWVVNFWVPDADATAATAAGLGGTVVAGPFDTAISRDAVLADPAGAVFTVSTPPTGG